MQPMTVLPMTVLPRTARGLPLIWQLQHSVWVSPTITTTARLLPQLSTRSAATPSSAIRELLSQARQPGMISLAGGLPDASLFPTTELATMAASILASHGQDVLQYGLTAGNVDARVALSSLFGPVADPDELAITTGSQQGLDLITRTLIDPGDQVVVGDAEYLGALQVFHGYGADVRPITIDENGLDTSQLEAQLVAGLRPKCCYIVPHFHNPTGVTMSPDRRAHLDELAAKYGFVVIEDDPYRELFYDGLAPATSDIDLEHTVQLRSTSKTLAPGLRVGVLRGPKWLIEPIVTAKQSVDLHTSSLSQSIVAQAQSAPWMKHHLDQLRSSYGTKRDAMVEALQQTFGDKASLSVPSGGMFLWVKFAHVADTTEWLQRCLDRGVCFVPGAAFAVDRDLSSYARLSFATGSVAELQLGIQRLAECGS